MEKDTGPANVIHDTTGPAPGIDAPRLEPLASAVVLEAIPRVVTVETVTRAIDGLAAELGITRAETITRIAAGPDARPGRCGQ